MDCIDWNNVIFNETNKKLIITNENLTEIPQAVINLYSDRVLYLDVSFNTIRKFNWIQFFPNLQTLILDNNNISDDILVDNLKNSKSHRNLITLSLNNNKLKNLILIKLLADIFPNLEYLSLHKNPLCPDGLTTLNDDKINYEIYKNYIIESFGKLKFLDHIKIKRPFGGANINRNTAILKFSPKMILAKINILSKPKIYSPLPNNNRIPGDHCGRFGIVTYEYIGKNSEGNRFISNNDL